MLGDMAERHPLDPLSLLSRALRKVAASDPESKLHTARGQAFFLGRVYNAEGAPTEAEVIRTLARPCVLTGLWKEADVVEQLRQAFHDGEDAGLRADLVED
jgi:hypothetical protein